jgi:hypothetical protein
MSSSQKFLANFVLENHQAAAPDSDPGRDPRDLAVEGQPKREPRMPNWRRCTLRARVSPLKTRGRVGRPPKPDRKVAIKLRLDAHSRRVLHSLLVNMGLVRPDTRGSGTPARSRNRPAVQKPSDHCVVFDKSLGASGRRTEDPGCCADSGFSEVRYLRVALLCRERRQRTPALHRRKENADT